MEWVNRYRDVVSIMKHKLDPGISPANRTNGTTRSG
jgi:hypothetical protein